MWQSNFRRVSRRLDLVMPSETSTACADQSVEELRRELAEARRREAATAEVLRVICTSATNVQTVFATIVRSAVTLCNGLFSGLFHFDGELVHLVAHHNWSPEALEKAHRIFPAPPNRTSTGRAILERAIVHIPDVELDPDRHRSLPRAIGWRSGLFVPMLRDGAPIGVIVVTRPQPGHFSDSEIELLKTFADQAVIAIDNTRLFEAEQARTRELTERTHELTEALEYQTATSDVLAVISHSKFDLQPTLDAIAGTASRLCGAADVTIFLRDGGDLRSTAHHGHMSMAFPYVRQPIALDWVAGRTVIDRKPIHVHDLLTAGEDLSRGREIAALAGHRTTLGIPLLREGAAIGCIVLRRAVVDPFAEKQITILQTFADQAVIAIENTRLFEEVQTRTGELGQALEYQTAISDVLGVIGRSKFDLQPVLTAIVSTACRLCEAPDASIALRRGDWLEFAAGHGSAWINNEWIKDEKLPIEPGLVAGRAILERRPIHIGDVATAGDDFARSRELAIARGHRTTVAVPLLREEEAIGCLFLRRIEVRPFSDKHVSLLETFA